MQKDPEENLPSAASKHSLAFKKGLDTLIALLNGDKNPFPKFKVLIDIDANYQQNGHQDDQTVLFHHEFKKGEGLVETKKYNEVILPDRNKGKVLHDQIKQDFKTNHPQHDHTGRGLLSKFIAKEIQNDKNDTIRLHIGTFHEMLAIKAHGKKVLLDVADGKIEESEHVNLNHIFRNFAKTHKSHSKLFCLELINSLQNKEEFIQICNIIENFNKEYKQKIELDKADFQGMQHFPDYVEKLITNNDPLIKDIKNIKDNNFFKMVFDYKTSLVGNRLQKAV